MEKNVVPISPSEIIESLDKIIPSFVFEAVNELLKRKFRGSHATIKVKEIKDEINKIKLTTSSELFDNKWLDFETVYSKYGWVVTYQQPDRDESFDSYFNFKPKK